MTNENSIKDTLNLIRKALEDDDSAKLKEEILILNKKINSDGTIDIISNESKNIDNIKNILDDRISEILKKNIDEWLDQKLSYKIQKHLDKKE